MPGDMLSSPAPISKAVVFPNKPANNLFPPSPPEDCRCNGPRWFDSNRDWTWELLGLDEFMKFEFGGFVSRDIKSGMESWFWEFTDLCCWNRWLVGKKGSIWGLLVNPISISVHIVTQLILQQRHIGIIDSWKHVIVCPNWIESRYWRRLRHACIVSIREPFKENIL